MSYIDPRYDRPARRAPASTRVSLPRESAVVHADGTRHCAQCGAHIDPIDWCGKCQEDNAPCGVHKRLRLRADAAFCDSRCRSYRRYTYIRDCL